MAWYAGVLLGASIVMPACGGATSVSPGGSGPDVGATPAEVENACRSDCDLTRRCSSSTEDPAACLDDCLKNKLGQVARSMRGDALRAFTACMASLPCNGDDDNCEDAMYAGAGLNRETLSDAPEVIACLEKDRSCPQEDAIREFCQVQMVLAAPARLAFESCLSEPCATVTACAYDAIYGSG